MPAKGRVMAVNLRAMVSSRPALGFGPNKKEKSVAPLLHLLYINDWLRGDLKRRYVVRYVFVEPRNIITPLTWQTGKVHNGLSQTPAGQTGKLHNEKPLHCVMGNFT